MRTAAQPSRIAYEVNGRMIGVAYQIEAVTLADHLESHLFAPLNFIEEASARIDVITDGKRATIRDNSLALVQAMDARLTAGDLKRRKAARYVILGCGSLTRKLWATRAALLSVLLAGLGLLIYFFRKTNQAKEST